MPLCTQYPTAVTCSNIVEMEKPLGIEVEIIKLDTCASASLPARLPEIKNCDEI